jgi:hypothetical protein
MRGVLALVCQQHACQNMNNNGRLSGMVYDMNGEMIENNAAAFA